MARQPRNLPGGKQVFVSADSQFVPADQIGQATIDAIRNAAVTAALVKAHDLWGAQQALTIRDLNATDMSYTNNNFTETSSATGNAWNAMAFGAFTVATGTVIAIYGLKISVILDGTIDELPISGVRIDVGGSRNAQWHIQSILFSSSAANTAPFYGYSGFTRNPIVVAEDIEVTISEYTITTSTVYRPIWLGVAVEKEGRTLRP